MLGSWFIDIDDKIQITSIQFNINMYCILCRKWWIFRVTLAITCLFPPATVCVISQIASPTFSSHFLPEIKNIILKYFSSETKRFKRQKILTECYPPLGWTWANSHSMASIGISKHSWGIGLSLFKAKTSVSPWSQNITLYSPPSKHWKTTAERI